MPHATPLFFSKSDSEEIDARSSRNDGGLDPSVGAAIQSAISKLMGSLADNLTQVIESRLSDFAKRFSEENSSSVEQAVKRARREHYTCKRKGNQVVALQRLLVQLMLCHRHLGEHCG